jgi:hypothetical protein
MLGEVVGVLAQQGVSFALVGGLAVSVRTEPRFTRDVDLAVSVADDRRAEQVASALVPPYEILQTLEHDTLGRLAAVRLGRGAQATAGPVVDLLFASSGIEDHVVAAATKLEVFPGVTVPVASVGHLIALKLLSRDARRPQDDADIRALLQVADTAELQRAAEAAELITRRQAHRDRDLLSGLSQLVAPRSD